ncbi:MAG: hypothetical protein U1E26_08205 [Coriobacteriia bacterium]|nr:hypothetical protein [Coriobacteriia bacterium]
MSDFKPSGEVRALHSSEIVGGVKVPHTTSQPLIRMHEGRAVIASFAFLYSADDMRSGLMPRPQVWLIADMVTGAVLERYECRTNDFSSESADSRYSIRWEPPSGLDAEYFEAAYAQLDAVRMEYAASGTVNIEAYRRYFNAIVDAVPPTYRVFYRDLGSPDML